MARPLDIYTFVPQGAHASYYYRIQVPMQTAAELGLPVRIMQDTNLEGQTPENRMRSFCEADIVLMYQPIGDGTYNNICMAKAFLPSKRDGDWKYPPTVIVDTDDNLFRVDPHNGAFKHLGIRSPDGRKLQKGEQLSFVEGGVKKVLWQDGVNDFDIERNHGILETYRQILNRADAVTCTTPRLKAEMEQEVTPRQTRVFPNLVRFDQYPQIDLMRTGQIKILWQGGANHQGDWSPLRDAVGRITQRYNRVHWVMWGVQYPWAMELIPPHRMTFVPWAPYQEYKLRRMMINDQINLAPLVPNQFNNCRSAIKWYEASVQKSPSATLAQRAGAYQDEIIDGQTGMLFDTPEEFEEKLSQLIENIEERKRLARNAKDWISENRDAKKEVPKMIRYFEQLREAAPREMPHMPEKLWTEFEAKMQAEAAAAAAEAPKQQAA